MSRATSRLALYAVEHADKVERLAFVGPGYRRDAPSEFPLANALPTSPARRPDVPQWPFYLMSARQLLTQWERERRCEDTADPGIYDAISQSIRKYADPGASSWGTPPGDYYRVPTGTQVDAGWNRTSAPRVKAPVLLVVGEHDPRFTEEAPNLYADIGSVEKILLKVQCATHFLAFERNHKTLHNAFAEFLTKGTVNGRQGIVTINREGNYSSGFGLAEIPSGPPRGRGDGSGKRGRWAGGYQSMTVYLISRGR